MLDEAQEETRSLASSASLPLDGASLLRFKQHLETTSFKREPIVESQLTREQRTWLLSLLLMMLAAAFGIGSFAPATERHHYVDAYNCGGMPVAAQHAPWPLLTQLLLVLR